MRIDADSMLTVFETLIRSAMHFQDLQMLTLLQKLIAVIDTVCEFQHFYRCINFSLIALIDIDFSSEQLFSYCR